MGGTVPTKEVFEKSFKTLNKDDESKSEDSDGGNKIRLDISSADIISELQTNKKLIDLGDRPDDSGSDSNPSGDDLPADQVFKNFPKSIKPKNKPKKSIIK